MSAPGTRRFQESNILGAVFAEILLFHTSNAHVRRRGSRGRHNLGNSGRHPQSLNRETHHSLAALIGERSKLSQSFANPGRFWALLVPRMTDILLIARPCRTSDTPNLGMIDRGSDRRIEQRCGWLPPDKEAEIDRGLRRTHSTRKCVFDLMRRADRISG
jgi:hypothetical protein